MHIETRTEKGKKKYYLSHSYRQKDKVKKLRIYLGANLSKAEVIADVADSEYADLFEQVWGPGSLEDVEAAYDQVALSIAAFERTELFAPFSSKYDAYLQACLAAGGDMDDCAKGIGPIAEEVGTKIFSKKEWYGFQLFIGEENDNDGILEPGEGAMCAACHVADWIPDPGNVVVPSWAPAGYVPPVFTDFTFDNLGVPKSDHRLLRDAPVDLGLGPVVGDDDENGKFNISAVEAGAEILIISQFTLLADTRKGRRPSFIEAAAPDYAESLFNKFVDEIRKTGITVAEGRFQQHMLVEINNDGPVTIMLDSKDKFR